MNQHQHPDDELLAAFADGEERGVAAHVEACDRCGTLVSDLRTLRASLATLPDLAPSRPLRFVPPVEAAPATAGFPSLVRRLFAPAMVAGAALVLVGSVGMATTPGGLATSMGAGSAQSEAGARGGEAPEGGDLESQTYNVDSASQGGGRTAIGQGSSAPEVAGAPTPTGVTTPTGQTQDPAAPAAPWLPVTLVGAALLIVTMVLRWTVVPRAPDPPLFPGA